MESQPWDGIYGVPFLREAALLMLETEKVCSCFGTCDVEITDELRARTNEEIDKAVACGVRIFMFGGLSDFDDLVYDIVSEKKAQNPQLDIKRIFCFPLYKHLHKPPRWYRRKEYEGHECPTKEFDWWYTSIYYRNCAMIDQSDLVLFYAEAREDSGAFKAYKHAVKVHKRIVNLAHACKNPGAD